MARIGTKQSIKEKKAFIAYGEVMELDNIIEALGYAMRQAYLPYIAESGRLTPKMEWELQRFKWHAMKVCNVRRDHP